MYPQSSIDRLAYANAPPFASINRRHDRLTRRIEGVGSLSASLSSGTIWLTQSSEEGAPLRFTDLMIGRLEGDRLVFAKNQAVVTRAATGQNLRDIVADKIAQPHQSRAAISHAWPTEPCAAFIDGLVCAQVHED